MTTLLRKRLFMMLAAFLTLATSAQDFNQYFSEATLRIDYVFSGNAHHQEIAVDELHIVPRWW